MLIRTTLLALNQAVQTGNFTVLRDLGSPDLQSANSPAQLGIILLICATGISTFLPSPLWRRRSANHLRSRHKICCGLLGFSQPNRCNQIPNAVSAGQRSMAAVRHGSRCCVAVRSTGSDGPGEPAGLEGLSSDRGVPGHKTCDDAQTRGAQRQTALDDALQLGNDLTRATPGLRLASSKCPLWVSSGLVGMSPKTSALRLQADPDLSPYTLANADNRVAPMARAFVKALVVPSVVAA